MARLLGEGGLEDEARSALVTVVHPLACALAIENRLPEPATAQEALLPPLASYWKEALAPVRQLASEPDAPWKPICDCLGAL